MASLIVNDFVSDDEDIICWSPMDVYATNEKQQSTFSMEGQTDIDYK